LPTKSTVDENPPVIATGTLAVVADQEVKAATEDVLGVLLELLELPPLPSQASNINEIISNMMRRIIFFLILAAYY
jgi:hypothetical protein